MDLYEVDFVPNKDEMEKCYNMGKKLATDSNIYKNRFVRVNKWAKKGFIKRINL